MPKPKKKARTPPENSLVDFDNPPVNEVVCGIGFQPLERLFAPYIGLWWCENQKAFPIVRKAQPIIGPIEQNALNFLERTMLVAQDETQMIQLQPTRFYYNWIKAQDTEDYPRYSRVYKAFVDWLAKFTRFVEANDIGVIDRLEYNLTYVNYIPQGHGWDSLKDIHKVLPDVSWRKTRSRKYLSEPADLNFRYVFPIREQPGRLTATIQRGIRRTDQVPILRLELAAQAAVADGLAEHSDQSMAEWFGAARKAIVLGFLDLTDGNVQLKYWGRRD